MVETFTMNAKLVEETHLYMLCEQKKEQVNSGPKYGWLVECHDCSSDRHSGNRQWDGTKEESEDI